MADVISLMDVDDDNTSTGPNNINKGKAVAPAGAPPPHTKTTTWVKKFRPQSLADVAAHHDIIDTIDRLTSENKMSHLLLYGPPGSGKTSTILAVARKLFGSQMHNMVLELNASDERGIDVVRQQIQDFASTQSFSFGREKNRKTKRWTCAEKSLLEELVGYASYSIVMPYAKISLKLEDKKKVWHGTTCLMDEGLKI
ncbi:hypothetical protein R6Q59_014100 [Mikania micrantha]